jgi:hypothetical protein
LPRVDQRSAQHRQCPHHAGLTVQRDWDALRPAAIQLIDEAGSRIDAAAVLYRAPPNDDLYGVPLLARLQREGVDFAVEDEVLVRQFGERRRYRGQPLPEVRVVTAMYAIDAQSDPNIVAFVSELSAAVSSRLSRPSSPVLNRFAALRQSVEASTAAVLLLPADEIDAEPGA